MKQAKLLLTILFLSITVITNSQVGIGTLTPASSSQLDISSTNKGLLIPRLTTAQRIAIASPATGLQVYDTDLNQFYFYNGSGWLSLSTGPNYWTLLSGNIYNNTGANVGIGTTSPVEKLTVAGTVQMTGFKLTTSPANGFVLTSDAAGVGTWQAIGLGTLMISGTANVVTQTDFLIETIYDLSGTAEPVYNVSIQRDRNQERVGQALSYKIIQKSGTDYWNVNMYLRVINEDQPGGYSAVKYKVWKVQ